MRFVPLLVLAALAAGCATNPNSFIAVERLDEILDEITWDATPPDAGDGTELVVRIDCGFLVGTPTMTLVMHNGEWVPADGVEPPRGPEELADCVPEGADGGYMEWSDDGHWSIDIGGVWHELEPSAEPNRWMGTAGFHQEPNAACRAGMDALGVTNPLTMSMEVVSVAPTEAS